jgi:hypothetical protein
LDIKDDIHAFLNFLAATKGYMIVLSITSAGWFAFIEKFIFRDWEFLTYLIIAVFLDTLSGIYKNFKTFSFSLLTKKLMRKFFYYLVFLVMIHGLRHFTVGGKENVLLNFVDMFFYGVIYLREADSVCRNMIGKGLATWIKDGTKFILHIKKSAQ